MEVFESATLAYIRSFVARIGPFATLSSKMAAGFIQRLHTGIATTGNFRSALTCHLDETRVGAETT
jgi:hypothetical protein